MGNFSFLPSRFSRILLMLWIYYLGDSLEIGLGGFSAQLEAEILAYIERGSLVLAGSDL